MKNELLTPYQLYYLEKVIVKASAIGNYYDYIEKKDVVGLSWLSELIGVTFNSAIVTRIAAYDCGTCLIMTSPELTAVITDSDNGERGRYRTYIRRIEGDLKHLIGAPLLVAQEVEGLSKPGRQSTGKYVFYKFATAKGSVTLQFSAGYAECPAFVGLRIISSKELPPIKELPTGQSGISCNIDWKERKKQSY